MPMKNTEKKTFVELLENLDLQLPDSPTRRDGFYKYIPAGVSNNQRTSAKRLSAVDTVLQRLIKDQLSNRAPLLVLDACCSNATTSVAWFEKLSKDFEVEMQANDLHASLLEVNTIIGTAVYRDDGKCIQLLLGSWLLTAPFSGRSIKNKFKHFFFQLAGKIIKSPFLKSRERSVSLFHRSALDLSKKTRRFTLHRHNILSPLKKQFDVIRIMNVFHNWPTSMMLHAVSTSASSLRDGGLLCVGYGTPLYTEEKSSGKQRVSVFRREGSRLVAVEDFGSPVREKSEVLAMQL